MYKEIEIIGFDADDTLWVNEPYFREAEEKFCELLKEYLPKIQIEKKLFETEINNLELYGYGVKAFTLSLVETAIEISDNKIGPRGIKEIINIGKHLLRKPIELIDGIVDTLEELAGKEYHLIVVTKGDLLDQQRKLRKSGLEKYFHRIEVMSDKQELDYKKLIEQLEIDASKFLMIGNSLKSDVLPVINVGGYAIHVPFHTTWQHEEVENSRIFPSKRLCEIERICQLTEML